jgi:hypothetical protein
MDRRERLRKNRHDYWSGFGIGFLRGSGLFSVITLALYNWYKQSDKNKTTPSIEEKGPESFEVIHKRK